MVNHHQINDSYQPSANCSYVPVSSPASLLQHISSLRLEDAEDQAADIVIGPTAAAEPEQNKNKKALIQVISSTCAPQQPRAPCHQLLVTPGMGAGSRGTVELTAELPRVLSVSECQLSVSQVGGSWTASAPLPGPSSSSGAF